MKLLSTTDPARYREVQARVCSVLQATDGSSRTEAAEKARAAFRAELVRGPKLVYGSRAYVVHRERALAVFDAAIAAARAEQ